MSFLASRFDKRIDQIPRPAARIPSSALPIEHGFLVHADPVGEFSPRPPSRTSDHVESRHGYVGLVARIEAQKSRDSRVVGDPRRPDPGLPVDHCPFTDAQMGGYVLLSQTEFETPPLEVLPDRLGTWGERPRLRRLPRDPHERQEGNATLGGKCPERLEPRGYSTYECFLLLSLFDHQPLI